jgi:hypothetical protein
MSSKDDSPTLFQYALREIAGTHIRHAESTEDEHLLHMSHSTSLDFRYSASVIS